MFFSKTLFCTVHCPILASPSNVERSGPIHPPSKQERESRLVGRSVGRTYELCACSPHGHLEDGCGVVPCGVGVKKAAAGHGLVVAGSALQQGFSLWLLPGRRKKFLGGNGPLLHPLMPYGCMDVVELAFGINLAGLLAKCLAYFFFRLLQWLNRRVNICKEERL